MLESYFAILPDLTWYFEAPALEIWSHENLLFRLFGRQWLWLKGGMWMKLCSLPR